jgi:hypothetical protein
MSNQVKESMQVYCPTCSSLANYLPPPIKIIKVEEGSHTLIYKFICINNHQFYYASLDK